MNANQAACPSCHQPITTAGGFCTQCGRPLANQATPPASQPTSPANQATSPASQPTSPANQPPPNNVYPSMPQRASKNNRLIIALAIAGIVLLLLIIGGTLFFVLSRDSNEAEEVSRNEPLFDEREEPEDGGDEEDDGRQEDEQDDTEEPAETPEDDQETEIQILDPAESNYQELNTYINENYVRCADPRHSATRVNETPYSIQGCDPITDAKTYYGFEITKIDSNREELLEALSLEGHFQCVDAEGGAYLAAVGDGFALQSEIIYGRDEGVELGSPEYIEGLNVGTRAEAQMLEAEGIEVEIVDVCQL